MNQVQGVTVALHERSGEASGSVTGNLFIIQISIDPLLQRVAINNGTKQM